MDLEKITPHSYFEPLHVKIPIEFAEHTFKPDIPRTPMHIHNTIEMLWVVHGELTCKTLDGKQRVLIANEIMFCGSLVPHETITSEDLVFRILQFSPEYFLNIIYANSDITVNLVKNSTYKYILPDNEKYPLFLETLAQLFVALQNSLESSIGYTYVLIHLLKQEGLFEYFLSSEKQKTSKISPILSYLNQNYTENINIPEIAEMFYFTPTYLSRLFKKKCGCTIVEYINNLRMSHAEKLLLTTQKSITEIAYESGFSTPNYFIRLFKKTHFVSPNEFRKNIVH